MRTSIILIPALLSGMAYAAQPISEADAAAALVVAQGSDCLSCHSLTEKIVGPSYVKVAAKYANDADAVSTLAQSIQYGSKGKWGRIPMPAHGSLTAEQINLLARWVLSIEK